MAALNPELGVLFSQLDDWFTDISSNKPISQFILDEDRDKLALISRTTINWFKSLTNPLTNEGIGDDNSDSDSHDGSGASNDSLKSSRAAIVAPQVKKRNRNKSASSNAIRNARRKLPKSNCNARPTLDSLVKDLESLLEDERVENKTFHRMEEPEYYSYKSYRRDDLTLLDDSVGHCCTLIQEDSPHSSPKLNKSFSIVMYAQDELACEIKPGTNQSDPNRAQTSTPLDHDYLPKPRVKPLILNNRLIKSVRNQQKDLSVLNTEAIKRFAPFSDRFRQLSIKHDRLLAVGDKI